MFFRVTAQPVTNLTIPALQVGRQVEHAPAAEVLVEIVEGQAEEAAEGVVDHPLQIYT